MSPSADEMAERAESLSEVARAEAIASSSEGGSVLAKASRLLELGVERMAWASGRVGAHARR